MESPYITVPIAARHYVFKSEDTVARMCQQKIFKSARKCGVGAKARWQILRREVVQYCGQQANKEF
jgi:hypothetical protein